MEGVEWNGPGPGRVFVVRTPVASPTSRSPDIGARSCSGYPCVTRHSADWHRHLWVRDVMQSEEEDGEVIDGVRSHDSPRRSATLDSEDNGHATGRLRLRPNYDKGSHCSEGLREAKRRFLAGNALKGGQSYTARLISRYLRHCSSGAKF
ncbi:hypothetical protein J6590_025051 [Homalodisca vitripennis]|nr:hypothetical protein J6590_025051 [Homalodisca vitripennis]